MKKLLYLFLVFGLFACSDDSEDDDSSSIVGRWNLTSFVEDGIQEQLDSCDLQTYMDLLEDGIGYYYQYWYEDNKPCGIDIVYNVSYYSVPNNSNLYSITLDYMNGYTTTLDGDLEGNMLTLSGTDFDEYIVATFTRD